MSIEGEGKNPACPCSRCVPCCVLFRIRCFNESTVLIQILSKSQAILTLKIQMEKEYEHNRIVTAKKNALSVPDNPNEFVYTLLNIQFNIITLVAIR